MSGSQPNTWHCPKCMKFSPPQEQTEEVKKAKLEEDSAEPAFTVRGDSSTSKIELRMQLADKITQASKKQLKVKQLSSFEILL